MNASTLIQASIADGLQLGISPEGRLKAKGKNEAVSKWLPIIKECRDEIVRLLREARTITPMNDADEAAILGWLARIGETDLVTIGEVIDRCRSDMEARQYFLGRARE